MKTIRYKNSRPYIVKWLEDRGFGDTSLTKLLLATLPSDKEEKKNKSWNGTNLEDMSGNGTLPSPSLLDDLEEITELEGIQLDIGTGFTLEQEAINSLIRNQKILINHLKHL